MAKPVLPSKPLEFDVPLVQMRKIAPERFEVVTGVVRGVFIPSRVMEKNVSLVVGREVARAEIRRATDKALALIGLVPRV